MTVTTLTQNTSFKHTNIKPIVKWVGGKRQLLSQLIAHLPETYNRYYEPFLGGGALFFALQPENAVLNDLNHHLMNAYQIVKDKPDELITLLKHHARHNSATYYYDLRSADRDGRIEQMNDIQKAARLLYMLRVDFNGIYRVNSRGQFNTTYGKYANPNIVNEDNIIAVSKLLNEKNTTLRSMDFAQALNGIQAGDFVYFDPPYIPLEGHASFTSYTAQGFNFNAQKRLQELFFALQERHVYVMLSNSDTNLTRMLYQKAHIHEVQARRAINCKGDKRGKVNELIITSY